LAEGCPVATFDDAFAGTFDWSANVDAVEVGKFRLPTDGGEGPLPATQSAAVPSAAVKLIATVVPSWACFAFDFCGDFLDGKVGELTVRGGRF